jgi:STE24 endopeptidase
MRHRKTVILLELTLTAALLQAIPFFLYPVPSAQTVAAVTLPPNFPPDYSPADFAKAQAFDLAIFWASAINMIASLLGLLTWLVSGIAERIGAVEAPRLRAWIYRILFFVAIGLFFDVVDFPLRFCRFLHFRAFGLSDLTTTGWLKLVLLGLALPLTLFVLKSLFVTCTLPLCQRYWWLVSALGIFLIGSVIPEVLSRTYPLDPVENLQALESGPHFEAMKSLLRQTGKDLPLMVTDESRRSKSASIGLSGRRGREYVVLTDTFLQQYSPRQTALALAHELGHFQRQTTTLLVRKTRGLLGLLLTFGLVFLYSGPQVLPVSAAPRVIVLLMLGSQLVSFVLAPISLAFSRQNERWADQYALQLTGDGEEYQRLLVKVARQELAPLDMAPWRYYWCASHPTFLERITQ